MSQPAIRAAFAEWRMVKSRKVLQLVFEVPLETQGEVLTVLGAPMPDKEIWCGIARLQTATEIARDSNAAQSQMDSASPSPTPAAERPGVEPSSPSARARASERYAGLPPMKQACERAGILATDERFQAWSLQQSRPEDYGLAFNTEEGAADFIRETCCDGNSRKLIATDPEAYRKFLALERLFHEAIGVIPEMR